MQQLQYKLGSVQILKSKMTITVRCKSKIYSGKQDGWLTVGMRLKRVVHRCLCTVSNIKY